MTSAFSNILVPTDFSPGSRLAFDYALALARRLDARIHVLHVVEDPAITGMWTEAYLDIAALREEREADARRLMRALLKTAGAEDASYEIAAGPVPETIAQSASDHAADFIVMGTHGRTGLVHALVGSVAERVIRTAGCPVLTVREGAAAGVHPAPVTLRSASAGA